MKTTMRKLFGALLASLLIGQVFVNTVIAGTPEGDFRILKSRHGIDLYYRWMVMPEGNRVRQMKAVLEIDGDAAEVLSLLRDEKRALQWISSAEQYKNLTQPNGDEWVSYIHFSVPWPLADQDVILDYKTAMTENGETVVDFITDPDYISPVEGVSRMKDITGSFVIRPLPGGRCTLECFFLSHKKSVIPVWLTDPIITGNILSLMEALRDELTEV